MSEQDLNQPQDESVVYQIRQKKLADLRAQGFAFPNEFRRDALAQDLMNAHGQKSKEILAEDKISVAIAGRMMLRRVMGKASFFHLQDVSGRIQVYIKANDLPDVYESFKHWDLGDIIGVKGFLFITQTGELTIHAEEVVLLTKSLRPLPDKFHGLSDQEKRYRQRYVDLIANEESRKVFLARTKILQSIRQFMNQHAFLEVETPMLHPIPGGASARPFTTHHNALDMPMFLRIAPELYLKRLVVGGFERVFEINRNFRNEGLSTRHNPEFTMMEFYQAYADYQELMGFTESLLKTVAMEVLGKTSFDYQGTEIDFGKPFERLTMLESLLKYQKQWTKEQLTNLESCKKIVNDLGLETTSEDGIGKLQMMLFEEKVEHLLIQPTFITGYPTEVSPLARASVDNPHMTDRFELFIAGRELANGFSELNDPHDQAERFHRQVAAKNAGDLEAMHFDQDYIDALEYGLPPTAGEGIGIDRLVMLLTNMPAIRDVILFPHLRRVE
ncbi:MAG: lysine--tRNA ligase [Gammaproteobacteria bacterium]|nr:lysine--tRNA ligase [Gammaproteobacteria bacterium]